MSDEPKPVVVPPIDKSNPSLGKTVAAETARRPDEADRRLSEPNEPGP